jgi:NADH-quinone oxidoreductase subunit J
MLLEAEFLAIVLVLVYVGAVMVLFLFVVMMLDVNVSAMREGFASYLPVAGLVAILMLAEMLLALLSGAFKTTEVPLPVTADFSNTGALGERLFTDYVYPFEIAGAILLVAIVAAIALTFRRRAQVKHQDVDVQMQAKSTGRVRLVDMPSEPERS